MHVGIIACVVQDPGPGVNVRKIDNLQGIGPVDAKLAVDLVQLAWRLGIADGRDAGAPGCRSRGVVRHDGGQGRT